MQARVSAVGLGMALMIQMNGAAVGQPGMAVLAEYEIDERLVFPEGQVAASAQAMSPSGGHLFLFGAPRVVVLDRDTVSGRVRMLGSFPSAPPTVTDTSPIKARLSPDVAFAYVADRNDSIDIYAVDDLSGVVSYVASATDGIAGTAGLDETYDVELSPDGLFVYVAGRESDAIAVFSRNEITGLLSQVQVVQDGVGGVDGLDRIEALAMSPDGNNVYAAGVLDGAVAAFSRDAGTGLLTYIATYTSAAGSPFTFAGEVAVSPDGKHVYAGVSAVAGDLAVFERVLPGGALIDVDLLPFFAERENIQFRSDGLVMYAESFGGMATLLRDPMTGQLTFSDEEPAFGDLIISPDDRFAYRDKGTQGLVVLQAVDIVCPATLDSAGCETGAPAGGRISVKVTPTRRSVMWKAKRPTGAPLPGGFYGDPVATTDTAVCLYDSAGGGTLRAQIVLPKGNTCPTKACWKPTTDGFAYKDSEGTPDGGRSAKLKNTRLAVSAKGERLGVLEPLTPPYTTPVTAQLRTSDGTCFEATFSAPTTSDATRFVAKND